MKTLAIAVVAVAAVAAVAAAGCSNGPPQWNGGSRYDDAGCKITCDRCPDAAYCVGLPYVPVCLQACTSDADCDTGKCTVVGTPTGPRVCVGPSSLTVCEPSTCSNPQQCLDAVTQLSPLPDTSRVCGWRPVHCDNGCDSATGSCK